MIYDVKDDLIIQVSLNVLQTPHLGFLSQIMSDLNQTFRISSQSSINMIHDDKDDPILQVSNQEPSMSSNPQLRFD